MEIDALVWVPDFNDVWASGKVVGLRQAESSSTIDARIEICLDASGQVVAL
eukprot:CAMPEP_0119531166 /NCGR_PEP_ID=MMETSP1344-20130328/44900_1 /TAXON_ID=236787 /ORGANISM="Florenciella parvula, Strain CCMP2471" /LENGTH=50 /DNA_ID=CAMNT_0007571337 /DNA_START=108 /DNA_END=256 /DNA_ORIENTATION=+